MVRKPALKKRIIGPGKVLGHVEVAGDGIAARCVIVLPWNEDRVSELVDLGDNEVLLAAFSAEAKGQQRLLRMPRNSQLIGIGDVAGALGLE